MSGIEPPSSEAISVKVMVMNDKTMLVRIIMTMAMLIETPSPESIMINDNKNINDVDGNGKALRGV